MPDVIKAFFGTDFAEKLGNSLIFLCIAWLVWQQMNTHIDGRLETQDARISDLSASLEFARAHILAEQSNRITLFEAIEKHLEMMNARGDDAPRF